MIVLFDIDDTLIHDFKYPTNYSNIIALIDELKKNNMIFGICTNRSFDRTVKEIIKNYHINGPIITESGSCIYIKNIFKYKLLNKVETHLKKEVKKIINFYLKEFKIRGKKISINQSRICSLSINIDNDIKINDIINILKSSCRLKKVNISRDYYGKSKIYILLKGADKISGIKKFLKNNDVILVTDYEKKISKRNKNIKIYSVGNNAVFNKKCDEIYEGFGIGLEKILIELRRKIK